MGVDARDVAVARATGIVVVVVVFLLRRGRFVMVVDVLAVVEVVDVLVVEVVDVLAVVEVVVGPWVVVVVDVEEMVSCGSVSSLEKGLSLPLLA